MIMCGSYCQMGPGENEGKNMEKGRDVKGSTIEKDEYRTPSNEFSEY